MTTGAYSAGVAVLAAEDRLRAQIAAVAGQVVGTLAGCANTVTTAASAPSQGALA